MLKTLFISLNLENRAECDQMPDYQSNSKWPPHVARYNQPQPYKRKRPHSQKYFYLLIVTLKTHFV